MGSESTPGPLGVVLAGGLGRRIGGEKAKVSLNGRPLVSYALAALREALGDDPVVVAKADTVLPVMPPGVEVWIEPDEPRHPLAGIVHALERAEGRDVLVLAVDLPLVSALTLRGVVRAGGAHDCRGGAAVRADGRVQPLCALYRAAALAALKGVPRGASLTEVLVRLGGEFFDVADPDELHNVNTRADARRAELLLGARG